MSAFFSFVLALQVQSGIPVWTLSASPTLTIEDDGTPATQFTQVTGVTKRSNGRIAIANRGANDVRIFDAPRRATRR